MPEPGSDNTRDALPASAANPAPPHDEILTEPQFAEEHNTSVRTAQRWREQGRGPEFIRIGPRRIGYRRSAIERWRDRRTFTSLADETARTSAPAG